MISYQHHRPYFFTMPDRSDPLVTALGLADLFGCVCRSEFGGKEARRAGQAQVQLR